MKLNFYCSFYGSRKSEMEFVGSKGAIYLDNSFTRNDNKKIVISNGDGNKEVLLDCSVHRYLGEVKDMYNAIVLEKPQQINQMESRDNVETVVSLLESANEDKVVSV